MKTPEYVRQGLEDATTDQLIQELLTRTTFRGVVVGAESRDEWVEGKRTFVFRYSPHNLDRDQAVGLMTAVAEKLRLKS